MIGSFKGGPHDGLSREVPATANVSETDSPAPVVKVVVNGQVRYYDRSKKGQTWIYTYRAV